MSAVASNPRQILKRAADEAPEPVVQALADAWAASKEGADERMVVIRFRRDGRASTEVFTPNRKDADPAQPMTLLDALQANEDLYQDALQRGRDAQRELLAAEGGTLTGARVADLLGLSRQAVDKRRRAGRLVGLTTGRRGIIYPAWQFTESGVLPGLEAVLSDLPIRTGWSPVLFMLQANAWVDDELPLHVLRRGEVDRVRRAAKMCTSSTVRRSDVDTDRPGPHPTPHDDLSNRDLPLVQVRPPWFRSHPASRDAMYFGATGSGRFGDPQGSYGVFYLGIDPECTFVEVIGRRLGLRTIAIDELASQTLSIISSSSALMLVDLTGAGLAQIGADARLFAGDHRISRLWSRAFLDHPSRPDGVLYPARHDPSRHAIALFQRPDLELWATPLGFDVLGRVLATYHLSLVP